MKLIFASNNQHKAEEIRSFLKDGFEILTLTEAGITIDIPEPHDTLEENATEKSKTVYQLTRLNSSIAGCFSEDTGLEVYALNGEPGVKSARYAGNDRLFDANIEKLLANLADKPNRKARFRAVISRIIDDKETLFEGICEGKIIEERKGSQGFGYDPIFVPDGSDKTFAEMSHQEKIHFSHRTKAVIKMVEFLTKRMDEPKL